MRSWSPWFYDHIVRKRGGTLVKQCCAGRALREIMALEARNRLFRIEETDA